MKPHSGARKGRGMSYFFIDLRRRYISDRVWYGMAAVAVGSEGWAEEGVLRVLLLLVFLTGIVLVVGCGGPIGRRLNKRK